LIPFDQLDADAFALSFIIDKQMRRQSSRSVRQPKLSRDFITNNKQGWRIVPPKVIGKIPS
jgi:hypothetical protein